jgi:hypothetical protein
MAAGTANEVLVSPEPALHGLDEPPLVLLRGWEADGETRIGPREPPMDVPVGGWRLSLFIDIEEWRSEKGVDRFVASDGGGDAWPKYGYSDIWLRHRRRTSSTWLEFFSGWERYAVDSRLSKRGRILLARILVLKMVSESSRDALRHASAPRSDVD